MTFNLFTRVRAHEVGLRFRHGELVSVLEPGRHRSSFLGSDQVYDRLALRFEHQSLEALLEDAALRTELDVIDLAENERAIVMHKGRLIDLLGPGLHAYWKQAQPLSIERYDVKAGRFEHPLVERILASENASKFFTAVQTHEHEQLLVYRDGEFVERFGPGTYVHWKGAGKFSWKSIDLREQSLDVNGQEIMTSDKLTLRVNLLVSFKVHDPLVYVASSDAPAQLLYREAQLALRAAVGTRSLEKLLSDRDTVTNEVRAAIEARATEAGIRVTSIGLRDVILPGEMKSILNQVIEAQKQAEANLIRRREETAAARSQANTARLMAENPVLLRMREMDQIGQILSGTKATIVLGGGDLASQVRKLADAAPSE